MIAHRGASGERPEHTLGAYRLAIEQGADFIEPDLVPTRDGVLIARHENELSGTTDVADHAEFAARRTTKSVDGEAVNGWFAEDFALAEIKTLRARERIPAIRPANAEFDGHESIPTLREIIALVHEAEKAGRCVGIYPETKHPSYFAREGRYLNGSPIARCISTMLIAELQSGGFCDPNRVFIQSFELANLCALANQIMPAAGIHLPLVLLMGDLRSDAPRSASTQPYDLFGMRDAELEIHAIFRSLASALDCSSVKNLGYADLATPAALRWLKEHGIAGVGPWKDSVLLRRSSGIPAAPAGALLPQLTGYVHPIIADAREAGLQVHPYTLRAERIFAAHDEHGAPLSMEAEMARLLDAGATGFFTDFPARGAAVRDARRRNG